MSSSFDPRITACFTGHRMIRQSDLPTVRRHLEEAVSRACEDGYRIFLCGGARGFDTIAGQTVLRLRDRLKDVRMVMVIPCRDQAARWTAAERKTWQSLCQEADEVLVLSETYYNGCMQARNRFMVDSSSLCLCWMTRFEGGTWSTVRYALHCGLPVRNLAMPERHPAVMKEKTWNYISISRSVSGNANTVHSSLSPLRRRKKRSISVTSSGKRKQDSVK